MPISEDFKAHLQSGLTTVSRCWLLTRSDGQTLGFTDHDRDLSFEGQQFRAGSGLSALTLAQGTGLAVDNTEALGALSDAAITEADIEAGRYDDAEVIAWLVNWADVSQRVILFRGHIGEIIRTDGAFRAELRGLTAALNRPLGRVYQKPCTAVLGDAACNVDLTAPGYVAEVAVEAVEGRRVFRWAALDGFDEGWFSRGAFRVLSGAAEGLTAMVKWDRFLGNEREVELWEPLRAPIEAGDQIRLLAGCDKRFETCRLKFLNHLNFQGFPDIPGEDWQMSYPKDGGLNEGGSLRG